MTELKSSEAIGEKTDNTEARKAKPTAAKKSADKTGKAVQSAADDGTTVPVESATTKSAATKSTAKGTGGRKKTVAESADTAPTKSATTKSTTAKSAAKGTGGRKKAETESAEVAPAKSATPKTTKSAAKGTTGRKKTIAESEGSADVPASESKAVAPDAKKAPAKTAKSATATGAAKATGRTTRSAKSAPPADASPTPESPAATRETPPTAADAPEAASLEAAPAPKAGRARRSVKKTAKAAAPVQEAAPAPEAAPVEAADSVVTAGQSKTSVEEAVPAPEAVPAQDAVAVEEAAQAVSEPEAAPAQEAAPEAAVPVEAAPVQEAAQDTADFPSGFGDSGPEDFFAALDQTGQTGQADGLTGESADAEPESGERKRRGRSRRGGRGRKKSSAQAAEGASSAAPLEARTGDKPEISAPEDSRDQDDFPFDDIIESAPDHPALVHDDDTDEPTASKAPAAKAGRRKMFVSVLPEEQVEVVITEEGQVQEYYVEMLHQAKTKGNIYKGIVHNVDPNLQAAFVTYGAAKNGFLQIDEVHPEYYVSPHDGTKGRKYPPIQKVLKSGQELLVQVVKEPAGTKGAFLTTYLSMPGRFLVLTPGREQIGVSRKVESETERARLRELLEGLNPGPGLGVIVRTVSMGASKTNLQRDLQFLKRTWKEVRTRGTTEKAPCLVYQEMDLTSRAVRDYLTDAIGEIWIDDETTHAAVTEIAEALFPRKQNLVRLHKDGATPLFERFNLQKQLDQIHSREVSLPSGGRLVIDPTEALTAIDINSGRSSGKNNFEDMAYRTNMEAAKMIPLQLRLRDIGGQIVADFIEMRDKSHWREVEKTLRNGMKVDRARYDVGKIGPFGMLEIVRQRLGSSAISISTEPCPCCNGTGVRRNMEWQSQHALRDILRLLRNAQANNESVVTYTAEQPVALHLLNHKRQRLLDMEQRYGAHLDIVIKASAE